MIDINDLTEEQKIKIYNQVKAQKERSWRATKQSQESKEKKRKYMREYMRKKRAKANNS